jgi:hypothetical protein
MAGEQSAGPDEPMFSPGVFPSSNAGPPPVPESSARTRRSLVERCVDFTAARVHTWPRKLQFERRFSTGASVTTVDPGETLLRLVTQSAARAERYAMLLEEAYEAAERLKQAHDAGVQIEAPGDELPTLLRQPVVILIASSTPGEALPLSATRTARQRTSASMSPARRSEGLLILRRRSVNAAQTSPRRP